MPSRVRILFATPFQTSSLGGGSVAHGNRALSNLRDFAQAFSPNTPLVPPPGANKIGVARWLWARVPKLEKQGAHLWIIRENRRQNWKRSQANPNNMGYSVFEKHTPLTASNKFYSYTEAVAHHSQVPKGLEAAGFEDPPTLGELKAKYGQKKSKTKTYSKTSYAPVTASDAAAKPEKPKLAIGIWS